MPRYDYFCPANDRVVEVRHGVDERLDTWGEVREKAGLADDGTPAEAPVERMIHAPALSFPRGDAQLKNLGFTKLVRRDSGVYENVTASGNESRIVDADNPAAGLNLGKKLGD
jgi:hypothetical protein